MGVKEFSEALGADVVLPVTSETVYALRQRIVRLEDAGRRLAKAARHCPHACLPPCPHTRQMAEALGIWELVGGDNRG